MPITLIKATDVQLASANEWLACIFPFRSTVTLTPNQTIRKINDNYQGGWDTFIVDLGSDNWA